MSPEQQADTPVEEAEIGLARRLRGLRHHPAVKAAEPLSKMADQPPMIALSAAGVVLGLALRQPRLAEAGARMLAAVLLATAMKTVIKKTVTRSRPHVVLDRGRYKAEAGGSDDKGEQSFPSGHTADAVAAARAVARAWPPAAVPGYVLAGGVAALQPAGAKHFPSDVAAGALIGCLAELLVDRAARALNASAR